MWLLLILANYRIMNGGRHEFNHLLLSKSGNSKFLKPFQPSVFVFCIETKFQKLFILPNNQMFLTKTAITKLFGSRYL